MNVELKLIHLQLTYSCNLNCSFCGQWGLNGFMHGRKHEELAPQYWLQLIDEIGSKSAKNGSSPEFIIWGGEPLISPVFTTIAKRIKAYGFKVSVVTNGILIEKFYDIINEYVDTIYISLDGPENIHEKIRGKKGIYAKIVNGIKRLDSNLEIINLLTICRENVDNLTQFPHEMARIGFKSTVYQNLIYCSSMQAEVYSKWLKNAFTQETPRLKSWIIDEFGDWINKLPFVIAEIERTKNAGLYPIKVEIFPYELNSRNILDWFNPEVGLTDETVKCMMPYRHLHINPDGTAHFCVDFNDFNLGNAVKEGIYNLFHNRKAEEFRRSRNSLCKRCPWFYNKSIK